MNPEKKRSLSLFLLRSGVGIVFILFGIDKLPHPERWIAYFPHQLAVPFFYSPYEFLRVQGILEVLVGTMLLTGFLTRVAAVIATSLLLAIVYLLMPDPIAIRDLGLFFSSAAIIIAGPGHWSLDKFLDQLSQKPPSNENRSP